MAVATQNPLNLPAPPKFGTLAEERQHRKQEAGGHDSLVPPPEYYWR